MIYAKVAYFHKQSRTTQAPPPPHSSRTRLHPTPKHEARRPRGGGKQPILVRERTTTGQRADHYWSENEPLLVRSRTNSGSYHPPMRDPTLQQHRSTTSSYNKARYPSHTDKEYSQAQPSQESWRLAVFIWSGAIEPKALATRSSHKRNCASYSQAFEDGWHHSHQRKTLAFHYCIYSLRQAAPAMNS